MASVREIERERRIAAARARRTERSPFGPEETVLVSDLVVGDYLVRVDQQANIRGYRIGALVESIEESYETWGQRGGDGLVRRLRPVHSRRISTRDGVVDYPAELRAVVRRST